MNCLQLQCLLWGIKRHQGSSLPQHQPVTADFMRNIQPSLEAHNSEHIMLWAACCLRFFGFLRAGEFTVNCAFDPSIHITVHDLQVDAEANPSSLRVRIKSSKTDPFHQGWFYIPGVWSGLPLSNFGNPDIFTSARALVWSPFHRHPWSAFNLFSSVFLHPVCLTGSRNPWAFFRPQLSHWGCHHGCAMRHSRSPYQDLGLVV